MGNGNNPNYSVGLVNTGCLTFSGQGTLNGAFTLTVNSPVTLTGNLGGTNAALTKAGNSILTLAGADNTYAGSANTTVTAGCLVFASNAALNNGLFTGGGIVLANATVAVNAVGNGAAGNAPDESLLNYITTSSTGVLALTGNDSEPLNLVPFGNVRLGALAGVNANYSGSFGCTTDIATTALALGGGGGCLTFSGSFANAPGCVTVNLANTPFSEVILNTTAANMANMAVEVDGGLLMFASNAALPTGGNKVLVTANGAVGTEACLACLNTVTRMSSSSTGALAVLPGQIGSGNFSLVGTNMSLGAAWGCTVTLTANVVPGAGGLYLGGGGGNLLYASPITAANVTNLIIKDVGGGCVALLANATYPGTTTITAGTLQLGNGGTAGQIGCGPVVDNGNLVYDLSTAISQGNTTGCVGGNISGTGNVVQLGTGYLTLNASGANTYTGQTLILGGTVQVASDAAFGTAPANVIANQLVIDGGTLVLANTANTAANETFNANRGITVGNLGATIITGGSQTYTLAANITGTGNVTFAGSQGLTLTANNSYTGLTTLTNAAPLSANTASAFGASRPISCPTKSRPVAVPPPRSPPSTAPTEPAPMAA